MHIMQSRRDFLVTLSAAGAAGISPKLGYHSPTRDRRK